MAAVLDPIKLIVTNYPEGQVEWNDAINNPEDPEAGTHAVPFARELYIERDDFMEDAPSKYFRLTQGREVRLKNAYVVVCTGFNKDTDGNVTEVLCEYIPETKSGQAASDRKVKGTIHYVTIEHSLPAEVRIYDRLLSVANPADEKDKDFTEMLNPDSLKVLTNVRVEAALKDSKALDHFQFQRIGYFNVDPDSTPEHLVFNRTVSLKDTWGKIAEKMSK